MGILILEINGSLFLFNGDARPITNGLLGASELIEKSGLATVGIANKANRGCFHKAFGVTTRMAASWYLRLTEVPLSLIWIGSPRGGNSLNGHQRAWHYAHCQQLASKLGLGLSETSDHGGLANSDIPECCWSPH